MPKHKQAIQYPSRWRRFGSMMYEGVLLFGVIFLVDYAFEIFTESGHAMALRHARQALLFFAIGLYFLFGWRKHGQTLPMKTWNIKIVNVNGTMPNMSRLLLRYILAWPLPLLGVLVVYALAQYTGFASTNILFVFTPFTAFIWTWFDPQKQFFHDRMSGTRLIHSPS